MTRTEVAIIVTDYLKDYIRLQLDGLETEFSYYIYNELEELEDIFQSIDETITGVIACGAVPAVLLRRLFPQSGRIIKAFNNDDADIYKFALRLMKNDRQLAAHRVYADFMEVAGLKTEEYLFGRNLTTFDEAAFRSLEARSNEEIMGLEASILKKHLDLWAEGQVDCSVTRFSRLMPQLKAAGLNAHFVYPGRNYMRSVVQETLQEMKILELRDQQAAAMMVTIRLPEEENSPEGVPGFKPDREFRLRLENLNQALRRFSTVYQLDFILRPQQRGFEVLTARRVLAMITDNFQTCRLQDFLLDRLDFDIYVGYGIGVDMYQARINAVDAVREAGRLPFGASCLVNEFDQLIGPLKSGNKLVISREVSEPVRAAAKRSGLSYLTVQKVMAAVKGQKDRRITSNELAHKLAITKRSANRFLSALGDAGLAEPIEVRRSTTKGRPERIYQIEDIEG